MKRAIKIKDIPNGTNEKGEQNVIRIEVSYRLGGINFMTGRQSARGYYIAVQPMTIGDHFESFMAFSGVAHCIVDAKRYSAKKLADIAETVEQDHSELIERMLTHVRNKS